MSGATVVRGDRPADTLRPGGRQVISRRHLRIAAWVTIAATAVELAASRHWNGTRQVIPWVALVCACAALIAAAASHVGARRASRAASAAVLGSSLYGVLVHVQANYDAGPLDFRYETRWSEMSPVSRWWAAVNGSVGPAPLLAPLMLAQAAILVACVAWLTPPRRRNSGMRERATWSQPRRT